MRRFIESLKKLFRSGAQEDALHLELLQKKLGYRFRKTGNMIEALTHRSTLGELKPGEEGVTYERLEFLGDSVLSLVTSDYLLNAFPGDDEGQLTKKKSILVSKGVLTRKAEKLEIKEHIILSENAMRGGVADQESVLTATLEALIGAVYIEGGLESARTLIEDKILDDVDEILEHKDHINYKSLLQEWTQSKFKGYPHYKVRSTAGPEHDKIFLIEVKIKNELMGRGRGKSKKDAEQMAAKEALAVLRKTH